MPPRLPAATGFRSHRPGSNPLARFLRARSRRQKSALAGASLLAVLLALAIITPVAAAEFVSGDSPRIPVATTLDDDLYIAGNDATIAGTIAGDALVACRLLDMSGTIERSLAVAAQDVDLSGSVGHAVRAAGNEIRISGTIGGDLVVAGARVIIESSATVSGDLIAASDVEMRGQVGGDVRATGNAIEINGPVGGDVELTSDDILIGADADLAGDVTYTSNDDAVVANQAQIAGSVERNTPDSGSINNATDFGGGAIGELFRLLAALVAGLVVILLMPRAAVSVAESVRRRTGPTLLLGLILLFAIPLGAVLLMVTVIGIPIGIIALTVMVIVLYLSQVFVGTAIGRLILPESWGDGGRGFNLLAMALGVILLGALRLIPIPVFGFVVAALTALLGLGAVFIGLRRRPVAVLPASNQGGVATY